jgi:hypothetical protein
VITPQFLSLLPDDYSDLIEASADGDQKAAKQQTAFNQGWMLNVCPVSGLCRAMIGRNRQNGIAGYAHSLARNFREPFLIQIK